LTLTHRAIDRPASVIVSYARKDRPHLKAFLKATESLQQQRLMTVWYDQMMTAGSRWKPKIDREISQADVIVLLLTKTFLRSAQCRRELALAMKRESVNKAVIFSVVVTSPPGARARWTELAPYNRWQLAPRADDVVRPIVEWPSAGWKEVDAELRAMLADIRSSVRARRSEKLIELDTAPDARRMVGRDRDLREVMNWVEDPTCRMIVLQGFKGIGKSMLASRLAHDLARHPRWAHVIWRRVQDAPSVQQLLHGLAPVLRPIAPSQEGEGPGDERNLFLEVLKRHRCLLVIDNVESLFKSGTEKEFRDPDYARLLEQLATTNHQSCVVLTSRTVVREVEPYTGDKLSVRVKVIKTADWPFRARHLFAGARIICHRPRDREGVGPGRHSGSGQPAGVEYAGPEDSPRSVQWECQGLPCEGASLRGRRGRHRRSARTVVAQRARPVALDSRRPRADTP